MVSAYKYVGVKCQSVVVLFSVYKKNVDVFLSVKMKVLSKTHP